MTTLYTRTFDLKDSLSDSEVADFWKFCVNEIAPAVKKIAGTRSIKFYSGAGGLRADLTVSWEMDDAGVYERAIQDAEVRRLVGKFYGAMDMRTSGQNFQREIDSQLLSALGG